MIDGTSQVQLTDSTSQVQLTFGGGHGSYQRYLLLYQAALVLTHYSRKTVGVASRFTS